MNPVNPDSGAELTLAWNLLEEAGIPPTFSLRILVADCIRLLARQGDMKQAADIIAASVERAERNGERVNRFWFEDRKYLDASMAQPIAEAPGVHTREQYEQWAAMSDDYKAAHKWIWEVPA